MHDIIFLKQKAYELRKWSILMTTAAGSGHPTSCLSAADLVAALFFHTMRYDPKDPHNPDSDRFILSKGHAAPLLYAAWQQAGAISEQELMTYRKFDSILEGHPTRRFPYTQAATGSLGIGLSIGAGVALSALQQHRNFKTYVLMGDSEIAEGSVWEAAELASYYKLNNLVGIVDCNRLGQSTETMHGYHMQRYVHKFEAFGWKTIVIDGHDMAEIVHALDKAQKNDELPFMIIAKTIKGYGVASVENKEGFHGKAFTKEELDGILQQLKTRFDQTQEEQSPTQWQPTLPQSVQTTYTRASVIQLPPSHYKKGDSIATRKAYGESLAVLGRIDASVVSLDAEVNNSTFADIFANKFPARFYQCFIAEQNMIGMATGMATCNLIPFASTFGAFMTRAHDQIRMAAIGTTAVRLVGSHAGISIGQDGPSQMALEDIALMRCLPESIVLYPSDAVSTHALVELMANYHTSLSYLRTTRGATSVIYDVNEAFPLGECKILRQSDADVACLVAAGITLHEALKAYELLQEQEISVAVVDLYCVKPLPTQQLIALAKTAGNTIVTIEDHYIQGGIGEAIAAAVNKEKIRVDLLAVRELPRSGKPEELLAWAGIDAAAIVKKVMSL